MKRRRRRRRVRYLPADFYALDGPSGPCKPDVSPRPGPETFEDLLARLRALLSDALDPPPVTPHSCFAT